MKTSLTKLLLLGLLITCTLSAMATTDIELATQQINIDQALFTSPTFAIDTGAWA